MHILHVVHCFLPVTENWIYSQIVFNTRCRSSVLCQYRLNNKQFPFERTYSAHKELSLSARLFLLEARIRGRYRSGFTARVIREARPDIIHGHFANESWGHLAAVRQSGIPLVTTFYGIDVSKLPRRTVWRKRYAGLFDYGAAFIVEGTYMAEKLAALGCPAGKIHCIPIGVDLAAFNALPARRRGDTVRILFVGLGREKKGSADAASAFITAAGRYPNIRFDVVGDGPYRKPMEQRFRETGIFDLCTFHGFIPVTRYRELLSSTDIVLAPSVTAADGDTEGGAPVTVIEAQAAGIPVVGTLHCDIPMVVLNNETGLLAAEHDSAALSANLEKLIQDTDLRKRMGSAAIVHAKCRHDIRKQADRISEVYLEACSRCALPGVSADASEDASVIG